MKCSRAVRFGSVALAAMLIGSGCSKDNAVDASQNTECGDNTLDCVPCASGELRCDGAVLKACQPDGQGFDAVMSCATAALCVKGLSDKTCAVPECTPADTRCDGATMRVCSAGRDKFETTECPSAASCTAGLASGKCAAGECSISTDCTGVDTECRKRTCIAGVCGSMDQPKGTICETNRKCDGAGLCVGECNVAAECAGQDTDCRKRTCDAGVCGFQDLAPGTIATSQTEGDCKRQICDGQGGVTSEPLPADVPSDGNDCTISTCEGPTPKTTWAAAGTVCNGTGVCDANGNCVACVATTQKCNGNAVQTCQTNGQWDLGTPCVNSACVGGACVGACVPGSKQCAAGNNVPQTCDVNGVWQGTTPCPSSACTGAGECTGSCAPASTKCGAGNDVLTCTNAGGWPMTGTACVDSACFGGVCVGNCVPGSKNCSGQILQTCDAEGGWAGTACSSSACVVDACIGVCVPAAKRCDEQVPQTCDVNGVWGGSTPCSSSACVNGACEGNCVPGAKRCSGRNVETCDASGVWQTTQTCNSLSNCASAVCIPIPSCVGVPANCGPTSNESCCESAVVPAGAYMMGRSASGTDQYAGGNGEVPEHSVSVSAFRLELYEVTVGRFRKFVESYPGNKPAAGMGANPSVSGTGWDTAWTASLPADQAALKAALGDGGGWSTWRDTASTTEQKPINFVTWYEAFAFCAWDGGWLPTEAEWEKAAAGGEENRLYPWGANAPNASLAAYECTGDGSASSSCGVSDILAVGSKPAGKGRWGHYDLAGNMQELVFDWYSETWYSGEGAVCSNCANRTDGTKRVLRGGVFNWPAALLRAAHRHQGYTAEPSFRHLSYGFRCARPAP